MSHYGELEEKALDQDIVYQPKHYQFFDGTETIQVIAKSMTVEQFRGYCMGNKLKYVMRASKKGNPLQDLRKADFYDTLFEDNKKLCRG